MQDEARKNHSPFSRESLELLLVFYLDLLDLVDPGSSVSSLLAGAGIAGGGYRYGSPGLPFRFGQWFLYPFRTPAGCGDNVRLTNGSIIIAGIVSSVGIRTTLVRDFDGTLHFVPNPNITVVSNLSRGDMRAVMDIPLGHANTDLDKIYQVIARVNPVSTRQTPEVLTGPTILGPQIEKNGRYSFHRDDWRKNGTRRLSIIPTINSTMMP